MATNLPADSPRVSPALYYDDPKAALEWLAKAFGFATRLCVTNGEGGVVHAEVELDGGVVQVGPTGFMPEIRSPRSLGGALTAGINVFVDDVEAHYARARAAGARIAAELTTKDYGDRSYGAFDCEGHFWWFAQRVDDRAWNEAVEPYRGGG
jgi:uncharacterized glyoxalase superfamily protein PhnB